MCDKIYGQKKGSQHQGFRAKYEIDTQKEAGAWLRELGKATHFPAQSHQAFLSTYTTTSFAFVHMTSLHPHHNPVTQDIIIPMSLKNEVNLLKIYN